MRYVVLAALALILAACGVSAQEITPQQNLFVIVAMRGPQTGCHVEAETLGIAGSRPRVAFSAEGCDAGEIILFRIEDRDGSEVVHDGGVYAGGDPTFWPVRPGTWDVVARSGDRVLGSVIVVTPGGSPAEIPPVGR